MASFNLSKILGGLNSTIGTINKAIPIYKQVSPIVKNVKDAFNTVNSIKEASKETTIKEVKKLERPISNFKKKTTDNRKDSLDTLTFFQ